MRTPGKTAGSPFVPFVNTSPLIDPGAEERPWAKHGLRNSRIVKAIPINARMAAPPGHLNCNVLPKPRASDAICFKALRKREMQ
jgi:hypothetical protein